MSGCQRRSAGRCFAESSCQQPDNTYVRTILHSKRHSLCEVLGNLPPFFMPSAGITIYSFMYEKNRRKMFQVTTPLLCEISHKRAFWNVTACVMWLPCPQQPAVQRCQLYLKLLKDRRKEKANSRRNSSFMRQNEIVVCRHLWSQGGLRLMEVADIL